MGIRTHTIIILTLTILIGIIAASDYSEKYFGEMVDFTLEDCSQWTEDSSWICEMSNHSRVSSSLMWMFLYFIISVILYILLYLLTKLFLFRDLSE